MKQYIADYRGVWRGTVARGNPDKPGSATDGAGYQQKAALVSQAASDSLRLDNLSVTMKGLVNRFVI